MNAHNTQHSGPSGNWALAISIALCAVLLSVFEPIFLIIAGGSVIWIASIIVRLIRHRDVQRLSLEQAYESHQRTQQRAELLASMVDAADIPVLGTDQDGHIIHTNRRAHEVLGIGDSMIGRRFDEIMTQQALHELESLARANEPGHARLAIPIAGEIREFDVSADPVEISHGAVLTFRDITELSRAMTLKADFVANASHELRTPIASIQGAAQTLSGPARNDERMSARLIEMISNNASRLELLAIDLLDLSKLESQDQSPSIEKVEICGLIEKAIGEHAVIAERRGLTLVTQIEEGLFEISTDKALAGLILRNLIGNATKFAHEETSIEIHVRRAQIAPDRTIPIPRLLNEPMGIELRVIDKGIGIPLAQQQRVFERFYQVDDARTGSGASRGTGLGLAIVKHAARRLGGTVSLESVHQVGTTMTIKLPRCADDRIQEDKNQANDPTPPNLDE